MQTETVGHPSTVELVGPILIPQGSSGRLSGPCQQATECKPGSVLSPGAKRSQHARVCTEDREAQPGSGKAERV